MRESPRPGEIQPRTARTEQFHCWLHLYHDKSNSINLRLYSFPPWSLLYLLVTPPPPPPPPPYITNIPPDVRSAWLLTRRPCGVTGPGWYRPVTTLDLRSSAPSLSSPPELSLPRASTLWLEVEPTVRPSPPSPASPHSSPPGLAVPPLVVRGLAKRLTPMLLVRAVRIVFPTS